MAPSRIPSVSNDSEAGPLGLASPLSRPRWVWRGLHSAFMRINKLIAAGVLLVASAAMFTVAPAGAQEGDLNCGDPGTSHNMAVDPDNDPNNLDADNDGEGCEDPDVFDEAPSAPAPEEPAPAPEAPSAEPVEGSPTFTG